MAVNAAPDTAPDTVGNAPARRRRPRRVPAAAYLLLALVATAGLWGVFAPSGHAAGGGSNDAAIANGRQLFAQGCASCHGFAGQGINGRAPSVIGTGAAATDFQVSTGRMPLEEIKVQAGRHPSRYDQQQIDQLAAYVQSLGGGPEQPKFTPSDVDAANLANGGEIFRANCASCHNYAGAGNILNHGRYAPNLGRATDRQIYEAMLTGPESMPVFGDNLITPQQKVAVIKFVKALRQGDDPGGANLGHIGPVPEGLVAIIIGIGGLVIATVWIGSRS